MTTSVKCSICLKGPLVLRNMYRPMREIHGCNEEEIELFKEDIKLAKYGVSAEFPCRICGKAFFTGYGRRKHMKVAHDRVEHELTNQILSTSHALLQSCFLCGKRVPSDSDEGDIEWLSCTNIDSCNAWAHLQCCSHVGALCSICENGEWQSELLGEVYPLEPSSFHL